MTIALKPSISVSIRYNIVVDVSLLSYLTAIDNQVKIEALTVVKRITPQFYVRDIGADIIDCRIYKFICKELFSNKVRALLCLDLISVQISAVYGLVPGDLVRTK